MFDQERMNELQLYTKDGKTDRLGFTQIHSGPMHPPYDAFVQSAGHQIGFNDLKTIEVRDLIRAISSGEETACSFRTAIKTERVFHALAESAKRDQSVNI